MTSLHYEGPTPDLLAISADAFPFEKTPSRTTPNGDPSSTPGMSEPIDVASTKPALSTFHTCAVIFLCSTSGFLDSISFFTFLPAMAKMTHDLHMDAASGQWFLAAYVAGMASTCMLGGRLADVFGARRILIIGIGLFTVSLVVVGASPWPALSLSARAFNGVGHGISCPAGLSIISETLSHKPKAYGAAIACFNAMSATGLMIGTPIGAALSTISWRWTWYGVAIAAAALGLLSIWLIPDYKRKGWRGYREFDVLGLMIVTAASLGLMYPFITAASQKTFAKPGTLFTLLFSLVILWPAFFYHETRIGRAEDCLIPPRTWKIVNFPILLAAALTPFLSMGTVYFADLIYWEDQWDWSFMTVAVHLLPLGCSGLCAALFTALRPNFFKPEYVMVPGILICGGVNFLASFQSTPGRYWSFEFPALLLVPWGFFAIQQSCYVGITRASPKELAGVTGGLLTLSCTLGVGVLQSIGTYIQAAVEAKRPDGPASHDGIAWAQRYTTFLNLVLAIAFAMFYRPEPGTKSPQTVKEQVEGVATADVV